eukprot:5849393-Prymnesium_polylepis.2
MRRRHPSTEHKLHGPATESLVEAVRDGRRGPRDGAKADDAHERPHLWQLQRDAERGELSERASETEAYEQQLVDRLSLPPMELQLQLGQLLMQWTDVRLLRRGDALHLHAEPGLPDALVVFEHSGVHAHLRTGQPRRRHRLATCEVVSIALRVCIRLSVAPRDSNPAEGQVDGARLRLWPQRDHATLGTAPHVKQRVLERVRQRLQGCLLAAGRRTQSMHGVRDVLVHLARYGCDRRVPREREQSDGLAALDSTHEPVIIAVLV